MRAAEYSLRDILRSALTESSNVKRAVEARRNTHQTDSVAVLPTGRIPKGKRRRVNPLLAALFERAAPFYLLDKNGELVAHSRAFAEITGALFGTDEFDGTLSETPSGLTELVEELRIGRHELHRTHVIERDESNRELISHHFPIEDEGGRLIGFGGIFEDVTPLAHAISKAGDMESWLQDVIRSSSDWIWAVDKNFNLTFVSHRITEALGVPAQTLTGRHIFTLGQFDPDDPVARKTKAEFARHNPFRGRAFIMDGENGTTRRILLSGVPVFSDVTGRFAGYRGTGTDTTRRHAAEQEARETRSELNTTLAELRERNRELVVALEESRVADKAKTDFLAMMSHELRTPLNAIIGFSDAALHEIHGSLEGAYYDYFKDIHGAGQHLLAIISDILDSANIENQGENQGVSVDIAPVRIKEIISEAAGLVEIRAREKSIDVNGFIPERDVAVIADRLRTRQILVNLLGNAVKFTPQGGKIGIDVDIPGDGVAVITVWDTGEGIPLSDQDRIFDRFYRVENNILRRGTEGTGLGLSISRDLAKLMGGDLSYQPRDGGGSRFILRLPLASPAGPIDQD